MNDSNGEKFSRETLIAYARSLALEEYIPLAKGAFKSVAVIDPWEKEICFSDGMADILGLAAGTFMYLSQFYQYIPQDDRPSVTAKYDSLISELMEHDGSVHSIEHKLTSVSSVAYDVEVSMRVESIDKSRFILAIIADKTPDMEKQSFNELFGPDIFSYLFVYDVKRDVCYLSDRFVDEFDLESNEMRDFSENYRQYIHPDDSEKLHEAIVSYMKDHISDGGLQVRFQAPGRGELYLRTDGFSDYGSEGRYVSGIFSDVTEFINDDFMWDNMIDGLNAAIFNTDLTRGITTISENIHEIFPDFPLRLEGDIVEILVPFIIPADRQRFRNILNRSMQETGTRFAIEVRIRRPDDRSSWVAIRGKSFENLNSLSRVITGSILDLSAMNEVKDIYEKAGSSHEVTGLPTKQRLSRDVDIVIRDGTVSCAAVVMFDINDFHELTDRYGREASDKVLLNLADLIITGRGGGSMEDLWAFNEKNVATAIYNSKIPVISAVGHEPDVTISDYVADIRAATPSNAAELAVKDQAEVTNFINHMELRLNHAVDKKIQLYSEIVSSYANRKVLTTPEYFTETISLQLDSLLQKLLHCIDNTISDNKKRLIRETTALDAMSPLKVLNRGYSIVEKKEMIIHSISQVCVGDNISVKIPDGSLYCTINEIKENSHES